MSTWGQGHGVSRSVRARVMQRDGGVCQLQYPGCTHLATEIDHIVNCASLGVSRAEANHEDPCQACCVSCHRRKSEHERAAAKARSDAHRARRRKLPVAPHPGD